MCVIAICEKRKLTDREMEQMWSANSHGAGVAWVEKGQVCYRKGFMRLSEFKQFYSSRKFSLPHIVHFRIASAGGVQPELTHPFTCEVDSPLADHYKGKAEALFHNGTYGQWKEVLATTALATERQVLGAVNDSRLCAILRHLVPEMLPEIARTSNSRFAVINRNGRVYWYGSFNEHNGILTSNDFWQYRAVVTTRSYNTTQVDACGQQLTPEDLEEFRKYTAEQASKKTPLVSKKVILLKDSDGKYKPMGKQREFKWKPDPSDPRNYRSPLLHKDIYITNGD